MYIAKTTLLHNGKIIPIGEEVDLTAQQAESLGELVEKKEQPKQRKQRNKEGDE
ncbi:hypothetical protein MKZ02_19980 [Pseudobacillus sp. FSL P4-0506]|uniref:DUF7210 family protein n=1 Tax=Pseudobacillus sp. FSL P4-0506 TaxID=2921576 RepID=UPI0030FB6FFF